MLHGTRRLGSTVSSDTLADASYPVNVGRDSGKEKSDRARRRKQEHRADDGDDADDVDRHAEVVEPRHEPDAEVIDERMRDQHAGVDEQDGARGGRQPGQRRDEQRTAVVDSRQRRELSGDVEPGGEPAPALAPEPARPVIHRPGRRQRGRQLRHAERDGEREHADQRPAERHLRRPAHRQPVLVERHGAREDRDDRKRNGEVREPAHRPEQLLRIAERPQLAGVITQLLRLQTREIRLAKPVRLIGNVHEMSPCCARDVSIHRSWRALRLTAQDRPFDSPLILSPSKDERLAQDRPVEPPGISAARPSTG